MPHKTTLLLNLDDTVLVALTEEQFLQHGKSYESIKKFKNIHSVHQLSVGEQLGNLYIFVINPEKVKQMIELIYQRKDDIIIFTSGSWPQTILKIISSICNLTSEAHIQFSKAMILHPQYDSKMLSTATAAAPAQTHVKGYLLYGLFPFITALQKRHFVLLDNKADHIKLWKDEDYIEAVTAHTDQESTAFYNQVLLLMLQNQSDSVTLSPVCDAPAK